MHQHIDNKILSQERILQSIRLHPPVQQIDGCQQQIQRLENQLHRRIAQKLGQKEEAFAKQILALESLSPLAILSRGYSMTFKKGKAVLDAADLQHNDTLQIRFQKGSVHVRVEKQENWIQGQLFDDE